MFDATKENKDISCILRTNEEKDDGTNYSNTQSH